MHSHVHKGRNVQCHDIPGQLPHPIGFEGLKYLKVHCFFASGFREAYLLQVGVQPTSLLTYMYWNSQRFRVIQEHICERKGHCVRLHYRFHRTAIFGSFGQSVECFARIRRGYRCGIYVQRTRMHSECHEKVVC